MKISAFILGCTLVLALLLLGQHHGESVKLSEFRTVIDLTHALSPQGPNYEVTEKPAFQARTVASIEKDGYFAREISLPEHFGTHLDAPAHFVAGLWTVDQIPVERLLEPLVVVDARVKVRSNPDYQISVEDIAQWEKAHGQIPIGAVVIAYTGWDSRWNSSKDYRNADGNGVMHFPGYSVDAAKFLVDGRNIVGLGIDTLSIDYGPSKDFPVHHYTLGHSLYHLENVANLDHVPTSGAFVVVAPIKLEGGFRRSCTNTGASALAGSQPG
jgi:kynurenine formamidase